MLVIIFSYDISKVGQGCWELTPPALSHESFTAYPFAISQRSPHFSAVNLPSNSGACPCVWQIHIWNHAVRQTLQFSKKNHSKHLSYYLFITYAFTLSPYVFVLLWVSSCKSWTMLLKPLLILLECNAVYGQNSIGLCRAAVAGVHHFRSAAFTLPQLHSFHSANYIPCLRYCWGMLLIYYL